VDTRASIVYGVTGQTLDVYPPEGVPGAAASYSVFRAGQSNDDTAEFSGTATADSVSTTVDASSGYSQTNRRKLFRTATTNIAIGRKYIVTNALGQKEIVTPVKIASGDYIENDIDLAYDYSSGATFVGYRQYFTVDATFVATESKITSDPSNSYRVLWSYSIGGVPHRRWTYFDLVRQAKLHNVTADDLMELWPDMASDEWIEQRGEQFARQIDAAFERVTFDAKMAGVELYKLRDGQYLDELVRQCALMLIAETGLAPGGRDQEVYAIERRKRYEADFNNAITFLKLPVDQGSEGGTTGEPIRQLFFRR
jgi:hypothetical protein